MATEREEHPLARTPHRHRPDGLIETFDMMLSEPHRCAECEALAYDGCNVSHDVAAKIREMLMPLAADVRERALGLLRQSFCMHCGRVLDVRSTIGCHCTNDE